MALFSVYCDAALLRNYSLTHALCVLLCEGNDALNFLTSDRRQVLRVELEDWDGKKVYAEYDNFRVSSESTKFRLISVGKYSGTAGQYHNLKS